MVLINFVWACLLPHSLMKILEINSMSGLSYCQPAAERWKISRTNHYSHPDTLSYCSPLSIHACYFYACRKFEKTKACIRHRVLHTHQEVFLAFWGIFRIPFLFLRSLLKSSIWVAGTSICSSKDSSGSSSAPNSKLINQDVI